jgi:hypothetical protein
VFEQPAIAHADGVNHRSRVNRFGWRNLHISRAQDPNEVSNHSRPRI